MEHSTGTAIKFRKKLYFTLEAIQVWLVGPRQRTGKYFSKQKLTEEGLLSASSVKIDDPAYQEILENINRKGIFIVGNARSGTTILHSVLNSSKEICTISEASLYKHLENDNFREEYSDRIVRSGAAENKTNFISKPLFPEINPLVMLDRHGSSYKYCGEKLAFTVPADREKFFDFQEQYFPDSTYFLTNRNPAEVIWSLKKMYPRLSIKNCLLTWLKSLKVNLRIIAGFQNVNVIFLENINEKLPKIIEKKLDVSIHFPEKKLAPREQKSSIEKHGYPEMLLPHKQIIQRCSEVYLTVKEKFSAETLLFIDESFDISEIQQARLKVQDLIDILNEFDFSSAFTTLAAEAVFDDEVLFYLIERANVIDEAIQTQHELDPRQVESRLEKLFPEIDLKTFSFEVNQQQSNWLLWKYARIISRTHLESIEEKFSDWLISIKNNIEADTHSANLGIFSDLDNLFTQRKYLKAAAVLNQISDNAGKFPEFYFLLGYCHQKTEKYALALENFNKAEELGFSPFWIYFMRGVLHQTLQNFERAKKDLLTAKDLDPDHQGVLITLESVNASLKDRA